MISRYSFLSVIIFYNIALFAVFALIRNTHFLIKYSTSTLMFLSFLAFLRFFIPWDCPHAYVISSNYVLPKTQNFFAIRLINEIKWTSIGYLIIYIWILGALIYFIKEVLILARLYKLRSSYSVLHHKQIEQIAESFGKEYKVVISPDIRVPYVSGVFRKAIYLPPLELTDDEWRFVLRHEIQHILSNDSLVKLFHFILTAMFWWNPVAHIFSRELDALLEMRCDAKLMETMTENERNEYLHTLLSVMKQIPQYRTHIQVGASAEVNESNILKQRFLLALGIDQRKSRRINKAVKYGFLVLFLLSYLVILQPTIYPPSEEIVGILEITPDNAYIMVDGGKYYLYVDGEMFVEISQSELNDKPHCDLKIIEGSD